MTRRIGQMVFSEWRIEVTRKQSQRPSVFSCSTSIPRKPFIVYLLFHFQSRKVLDSSFQFSSESRINLTSLGNSKYFWFSSDRRVITAGKNREDENQNKKETVDYDQRKERTLGIKNLLSFSKCCKIFHDEISRRMENQETTFRKQPLLTVRSLSSIRW